MTTKCSVCQLEPAKQEAVAAALRENVPLRVISAQTGLSRSALSRHSKHMARPAAAETQPKAALPVKIAVPAPVESVEPAPVVKAPEPDDQEARKRALDRAERLWSEIAECLQLAREPAVIARPDGSTLEIPVDLKTRSAVVRAGRDVIDLDARLNGLYDPQAGPRLGEVVFQNVILLPKTADVERHTKVVDAAAEPAALTDGGTPDSEK
jgi:hypothetical protein